MSKLIVFNSVSTDGYFVGPGGDMSWAHNKADAEWNKFTEENAKGDCVLVFGRITYEMMAAWWPTKKAMNTMPVVAERMNSALKVVFSRTLEEASWENTKLVKRDLAGEIKKLKQTAGKDLMIFGSGTLVSQLTQKGLIDEYQMVVQPVVLGRGRTMFEGVKKELDLKLTHTRTFKNGCTYLCYKPAA
ncbi:MAG: dihydrofolate reductase family protein [Opitutaceae bacterium]